IHIISIGARTSLGLTADPGFAAYRAGISGISEHPFIIDKHAEPIRIALDTELDPRLPGPERLSIMAASALEEICTKINFMQLDFQCIPLFVALPEERPGWDKDDSESVRNHLKQLKLPVKLDPIELLPEGHAAGLLALHKASERIKNKQSPMRIILGVDSYLHFDTLGWLDKHRQLANAYNRGAFFPGEGACAVLIASTNAVQQYALDSMAVVCGFAHTIETKLMKTDALCLGEGLTECIKKASGALTLPQEAVEGIICDINGERYRSEEWGFVILRCPNIFVDPTTYDLPAACWGDMGAASGPLFIGIAATAGQRGWAKGGRYIIWNSSECGHRAAVLLELNLQHKGVNL
ncbi:MAG: hypothetical protein D3903_12615, partial [Candidatus Electrothrix sp. GM3_4]|nr:hypothetical protein [Candidatus Electrothrix sp. GM3_4]